MVGENESYYSIIKYVIVLCCLTRDFLFWEKKNKIKNYLKSIDFFGRIW